MGVMVHERNVMTFPERIFVIGDIHGCLDRLELLWQRIDPRPGLDQLIFLGDYIDRGDDSSGVLDYLLELKEIYNDTVFLMGNHEKMFKDFLSGVDRSLFIYNGGESTLKSYLVRMENYWDGRQGVLDEEALNQLVPEQHRGFLEELKLYYETDGYIMVHAGLRHGVPEDFGKRVIFGHTPFVRPLVLPNKIGIDTGAVYGNSLTCLILPDLEFISV
jgi:serine/threonine protein phosphatase 1